MIAVETLRHRLALVVRVDDHFTMEPYRDEVSIAIDSQELPVQTVARTGVRHDDGTYRFLTPVKNGARQVTVSGPQVFTWTATTPVVMPVGIPSAPLVIEVWPTPNAKVPGNTLAIRGRLDATPPAAPVAIGQVVEIEVVGVAARNRRTRCDASGEWLFVVLGPIELNANYDVELEITIPGRVIDSIDIIDGDAITNFPNGGAVSPFTFSVRPGRETRALIHLS